MRHRHLSNPFTTSGINQQDNNHFPVERSYIPMGRAVIPQNDSFVAPVDHALRVGLHTDSRWSLEGRANEYPSTVSMAVHCFAPAYTGPPVDPYPHSSIAGNISSAPVPLVGHVHSSHYNVPSRSEVEGRLLNSTTAVGGTFKRKRPDIYELCEIGSSSSFYSAGSSSSSSQVLMEKSAVACHCISPLCRGANLSIAGEDSARNVRRRYRLDVPSCSSHYYQLTTNPANYSAPFHPSDLDADATSREWNHVPCYAASSHGRISPPDINGSRHETTQFHVGGSSTHIHTHHHDSVFRIRPVSSSQYLHDLHALPVRQGHGNNSRRVTPSYRSGPSYSHYDRGGTSSTSGLQSSLESSSRHSRHCSAGRRLSSHRSTRSRIAVERFRPIVDVTEARDSTVQETIMMVDQASFYDSSRDLFDQHRDMRLDIDSMSYEELLALEERIGTVSTGLSEDCMSKCLREKAYCSSDQNHEEVTCPICLEEYKNGDQVGTLEKCRHNYHVDCVKKWLSMKKVCPICKSECSIQESTEA